MRGEVEPCGFCVRSISTCTMSIVRKKMSPCVVALKPTVAMRKQENMPLECPFPGCSATPWVLHIKNHLARCHSTLPPNTLDLTEWVVVSRDDAKKKERVKKIPVVMKPKILLKVAQAVDSEAMSYSEASLGRSDWELKPEEDASSAESGFAAHHDLSSGNESLASSKDANTSSSSSPASSSSPNTPLPPPPPPVQF